jgi:surfeit locus 1 family protein
VHHILLDNQTLNGRTGVHVFTPFHTLEGITILVNRGWLPMDADRRSLPDVPTTPNKTILRGILNHAPVPGRTLGEADQLDRNQWPQLVTYLNIEDVASVLETPLNGQIIQLLKSEQDGFEGRSWKPVFLSSDRHLGYAVQWYAFAILSIGLWIIVGVKTNGKSNE